MIQFADFSWARPTQADLTGFTGAMRYLETGSARPDLTLAEVKMLHSWGKEIGLIWEKGATDATSGTPGGIAAAKAANAAADALGAPDSAVIFYAVDSDMMASAVQPYFEGIRQASKRPVGIYGSYALITWAKGFGIAWRWQALGWSYGQGVNPNAQMHQYNNNVALGSGAIVDRNNVYGSFPTWKPAPTGGIVANTAAAMVAKAASQIGTYEGKNSDGSWNNCQPYGTWYAAAINNPAFRCVAWCDEFISWVGAMSGNAAIVPKSAYVPNRLAYYRNLGQSGVFPPRPGDIGIVSKDGHYPHVFLVEKWIPDATNPDAGYVQTIEGNTNNTGSYQGIGVFRLRRRDSRTNAGLIYCRPKYAAVVVASPLTTAPNPTPAPAPTTVATIPVPVRYDFSTAIKVNDEALRVGLRSTSATLFNARLWSWLYHRAGTAGRAYCVKANSAWQKESSSAFGTQTLLAMQEAYRILNKSNPTRWPASASVNPKPTWPGPAFLVILGLRAD